jgi:hypothetical protein
MTTQSEIAAKLIVEAAVGAIAGDVRGQLGIAPVVLSERQCADLGLPPGTTRRVTRACSSMSMKRA